MIDTYPYTNLSMILFLIFSIIFILQKYKNEIKWKISWLKLLKKIRTFAMKTKEKLTINLKWNKFKN